MLWRPWHVAEDFIQMRFPLWTITYQYLIQPLFRPFCLHLKCSNHIFKADAEEEEEVTGQARSEWSRFHRLQECKRSWLHVLGAGSPLFVICPRWFQKPGKELWVVAVLLLAYALLCFLMPCLHSFYLCLNVFLANSAAQVSQACENISDDKEHLDWGCFWHI